MDKPSHGIRLKRVYEPAMEEDGERILVERLWPRGIAKEGAGLHAWMKDVSPSPELRKWYSHDVSLWPEFRIRYRAELAAPEKQEALLELAAKARKGLVTLVYAARDTEHNSARVLKEFLEERFVR